MVSHDDVTGEAYVELLEPDEREARADLVAKALGLRRVGFLFSRGPEPKTTVSGAAAVEEGLKAFTGRGATLTGASTTTTTSASGGAK